MEQYFTQSGVQHNHTMTAQCQKSTEWVQIKHLIKFLLKQETVMVIAIRRRDIGMHDIANVMHAFPSAKKNVQLL